MCRKMTEFELMILEKQQINCSDVEKLLGDYLEKDFPVTLASRITEHISECDYCREIEAGYKLTIDLARELGQRKMPKEVRRRFREGLNAKLGLNLNIND